MHKKSIKNKLCVLSASDIKSIALTQAGMVRMHGPFRARCPDSGRPPGSLPVQPDPAVSTASTSTSTAAAESIVEYTPQTPLSSGNDTPVPVPVEPVRPSVKLIRRLPKGSRELGGRKLAGVIVICVSPGYVCPRTYNYMFLEHNYNRGRARTI